MYIHYSTGYSSENHWLSIWSKALERRHQYLIPRIRYPVQWSAASAALLTGQANPPWSLHKGDHLIAHEKKESSFPFCLSISNIISMVTFSIGRTMSGVGFKQYSFWGKTVTLNPQTSPGISARAAALHSFHNAWQKCMAEISFALICGRLFNILTRCFIFLTFW